MLNNINIAQPAFIKVGANDNSKNNVSKYINTSDIVAIHKTENESGSVWKVLFKKINPATGTIDVMSESISDEAANKLNIIG